MKDFNQIVTTYKKLSAEVLDYQKFNRYAIVHHGSSIEGSTLTQDETFVLLDEQLTPKNKPLEHTLMTIDHLEALQFVLMLGEQKSEMTVENLRKVGAFVLKRTGGVISSMGGEFDTSKGDFRKATVRAGNRTFMDYKKVPERVEKLCAYINEQLKEVKTIEDCYNLAFDAHFQLISIHPFGDGNGRTSRLLMNYIQEYCNEPITIVFEDDKSTYFKKLEETREKEDINIFRNFMFAQAKRYFEKEIDLLTKKQKSSTPNSKGLSFIF